VLGAVHPLSNVRPCTAGAHPRLARPHSGRFPLAAGSRLRPIPCAPRLPRRS
jgi:hypothetical protein